MPYVEGRDCHIGQCLHRATHRSPTFVEFGRKHPTLLCDLHAREVREEGHEVEKLEEAR